LKPLLDPTRCTLLTLLACAAASALGAQVAAYDGACDASAAVALDRQHFIVGNDETSALAVYLRGQPAPVAAVQLGKFLGVGGKAEADIEGAAALGNRIYWITSHARDSKGRAQPDRQRFFATEVVPGPTPRVAPVGRPYARLLDDLLATPALAPYGLAAAARLPAEAEGGLNIEGLAATPDGRLLIGLRNPLPRGRALLIPLENPAEVIDQGQRARLGAPIELELGQRGIRSIELVGDVYYVVAGPPANEGSFALYRWSGKAQEAPTTVAGVSLGDLRPEAMFAVPGGGELQLISDDGGLRVGGTECKDLPPARQTFRSLTLRP
jgi:hypothetical protein